MMRLNYEHYPARVRVEHAIGRLARAHYLTSIPHVTLSTIDLL
jgi:hypothetical protein